MTRKNFFKYLTSLCFLALIAGFYVFSIYPAGAGVKSMLIGITKGQSVGTFIIEDVYREKFPAQNFFVTVNGGLQRLIGVRDVNGTVKLENGYISATSPENDVSMLAENTVEFCQAIEALDIPFLYISTPYKIAESDKMLPVGTQDFANENANAFLDILRENDVHVLDLRESMSRQGIDHYSSFFRTDHHWTPETGFWAFTQIIGELCRTDISFTVDQRLLDMANYTREVHENILLGSSGRRTGPLYTGVDDMSLIYPDFETAIELYADRDLMAEAIEKSGSFRDTLIFDEHLRGGFDFYPLTYSTYCGGDFALFETKNLSSAQGLDVRSSNKRILLLKDSFSDVVIPFLSLAYDDVVCLDRRAFYPELVPFITEYDPDVVMVMYNPGSYHDHDILFNFFYDAERQ